MNVAQRFEDWLGFWAGPIDLRDGDSGLIQIELLPVFNGNAVEMHVLVTDARGALILNRGIGLWSLNAGRVRCAAWGERIGFAILNEVPDDPGALALTGPLGDGRTLATAFCLQDGELMHSTSVYEGYEGAPRPRDVARLRRRASLQPRLL